MTRTEIKKRIAELIGKFHSFSALKTIDGVEMKVQGEKMEVGMPIYVVTPQGELPAVDDTYEFESGMKVKVMEGVITNIEDNLNTEGTPIDEPAADADGEISEAFDEAKLVDGTLVGTDGDFEVGKKLYVKDEAGEWVSAPEGEHVTESGIQLVVDAEGTITGLTRPDEAPEGEAFGDEKETMAVDELMMSLLELVEKLKEEVSLMKKDTEAMGEKFNKIAGSPAAEKHYDRKGYLANLEKEKFSKVEALYSIKKLNK
jgi:hypothetical protein